MSKYKLTSIQTIAIWKAHSERCFYCEKPVDFRCLEIDHIIPESLNPDDFERIKNNYGLQDEFHINSYYNLVPTHNRCNLRKRDKLFGESAMRWYLALANDKYTKIKKIEQQLSHSKRKYQIFSSLEFLLDKGLISFKEVEELLISSNNPESNKTLFSYIVNNFCHHIKQVQFQDAVIDIDKALYMFPDDKSGLGYYARGYCYWQLKDYQKAIYDCTKAIDVNSDLGLAYFVRGQTYFEPYYDNFTTNQESIDILNKIDEYRDGLLAVSHCDSAIDDYNNTIKLIPDHPDSYFWRALCKLYIAIRFRVQFFDGIFIPTEIIEDLYKSAEIYYKQSDLSGCKRVIEIYSKLIEIYKDIINYEDAKNLLNRLTVEYFSEL
ncbi:tetratricopeptide repeat protein [Nostoc punctiforme]|uniref:TPR repeat-containing protein n=1 Tax=Nostoc punctiforme (strain ATCC 29133 / PCC 73102) TaxID=63737 RepID=B2IZ88_NOSP7|nr:tetratricopeptide repeat protein [Nostoc punctiforme]ACC84730.1 TPR repeat-containing protein [Nostoc punctiforme PCC 73102]